MNCRLMFERKSLIMDYKGEIYCFMDVEATGVYWSASAPLQLSGIITDNNGEELSRFDEKIKTTWEIPPQASAVNHIYKKDLINCRGEIEVLKDYIAWIIGNGTTVLVGYNSSSYDWPLLQHRCELLGIETKIFDQKTIRVIDVKNLVKDAKKRKLFHLDELGGKWKQTLVAEKLGLETEGAHDSLVDTVMLKGIFFKLEPALNPTELKLTSLF